MGVALWLIARLGGTRLSNPVAITIGAGVFNLGVTSVFWEFWAGRNGIREL
jgi:hypothetical protein